MRLAILSDFHLGYERFEADAFAQAMKAVTLACAEADALLLPGDLFDSRTPKPESLAQALEIFRIPLESGLAGKVESFNARDGRKNFCVVPVIAIPGTHEARHKSFVNPIQVLEKSGFVVNAQSATVVIEKDGEKVAVSGLGGVPESQAKAAVEALDFKPTDGAFSVFMFHQSLKDFLPVDGEHLSAEDLPEGFGLYVGGHMHKKVLERVGGKLVMIPGSTVVTQLRKEDGESKGFYFFETKTGKAEFKEIESRPFFFKEVALDNCGQAEALEAVRREILGFISSGAKNPVIRIKVTGTARNGLSPSAISFAPIFSEFSKAAFISIDKDFGSGGLKEKVLELRALREKGASVRELGFELLQAKLKEKNFAKARDVGHLFELLSSGRKDAAEKAVDELIGRS